VIAKVMIFVEAILSKTDVYSIFTPVYIPDLKLCA